MPDLTYLLALLACPLGMGAMMMIMMRGGRGGGATPASTDEVARLRAEVKRLERLDAGRLNSERSAAGQSPPGPSNTM